MNWRPLLILFLGLVPLRAQPADPLFFTWHAFEYVAYEKTNREVTLQVHFRTHSEFRQFAMLRGAVYGTQRLPKGWLWTTGYLRQTQEVVGDTEWARQQRVYSSLSRPMRQGRLRHTPRVQYDYLFDMAVAAYGRSRFSWQTEWAGPVRPYAVAELFTETAGLQRFRPRVGVRFQAARRVEADIVYQYDRIYLRGQTNRHIVQTTLTFRRRGKD